MHHYDSRRINPGDTFICLPGGEPFIEEAKKHGATAVKHMTREQLAEWANLHFKQPSKQLVVIGITGTNGKTTVAHILGQALKELGFKPAVLGTLNSSLTTPESLDIQRLMADHLKEGGTHFVMEVSSHGIHQGRILEIDFDVKVLTNITQDHLDYHGSFEAYQKTKLDFMKNGAPHLLFPKGYEKLAVPRAPKLRGAFNQLNLKAAKAVLLSSDISEINCDGSLEKATSPPGRFECIESDQHGLAIVDFAHTPTALETILKEGRLLADGQGGKLLCVFGCGGERDKGKRPVMGKIACQNADFVMITQDNPRGENQEEIIQDILKGIPRNFSSYQIENDRKVAIESCLKKTGSNDVVIVAGKGHEQVQILASGPVAFDDREIIRNSGLLL